MTQAVAGGDDELVVPGYSKGLLDVFRQRYLLSLIVKKELRIRYHGSVLGMAWSYIKPAVQFVVYFLAMGVFLSLNKTLPGYPIYLFSGMVVITYFSEVMGNATRTLIWNAALIKKIFLPREMFPVASVYVAIVHFVPQLVVLLVGSLFYDWRPTLLGTAAILAGFVIVTFAALGLGLIFGCLNVFFRDSENLVDLILMIATWVSPVLYPADKVKDVVPEWMWHIYQANPVTVAVELFHYGFWSAATGESVPGIGSIPMLTLIGLVGSLIVLGLGQLAFKRTEGKFAQEL